jgi:hypothetical protein
MARGAVPVESAARAELEASARARKARERALSGRMVDPNPFTEKYGLEPSSDEIIGWKRLFRPGTEVIIRR